MAEKLEEYKAGNLEKLMMEKKRIETLINNMNDPVIGLDENKKVLFMNNVALKIAFKFSLIFDFKLNAYFLNDSFSLCIAYIAQNATCLCNAIKCIYQENIFLVIPTNNLLFVFQWKSNERYIISQHP